MTKAKAIRCGKCGKRLRKGGDNYRFECTIAADFDGYIHINPDKTKIEDISDNIIASGMSSEELEEEVYFERKIKLCHACRDDIIGKIKRITVNE